MPVMDGIESTQKIREFEKERNIPPALIMIGQPVQSWLRARLIVPPVTGLSSEQEKQRSIKAGADGWS